MKKRLTLILIFILSFTLTSCNIIKDVLDKLPSELPNITDKPGTGIPSNPNENEKPSTPLVPLEPSAPVEKPSTPLIPLEPSSPVEKPSTPLIPLEPSKPVEKPGTPLVPLEPSIPVEPENHNGTYPTVIEGANFSIHFLELGNEYTGDSTYIKAGNNDILIDAGSRKSSIPTIKRYLDQFVTDGKLEYVIATHAHQDHIAGFADPVNGLLNVYKVDTIIDFSFANTTSRTYENYLTARGKAISNGTKHYTAAECWNNQNGASRSFILGEKLSLDIIYNRFYFEQTEDENDYSVCTMFNACNHHFFLTGDLELLGEQEMVKYYDGSTPDKTLPQVDVFKAGHHGSKTSSNEELLSKIKPKICCVCCCAGNTEYTARNTSIFPTQDFINRISKYTDHVYITSRFNQTTLKEESFNGNIVISSNGNNLAINCSNNNIKLKDSKWFNEKIYVLNDYVSSGKGKTDFYNSLTPGAIEIVRRIWPKPAQ